MAVVQVQYTWPGGGTLTVAVHAKVNNPEALTQVRIEAKRLWHEALIELEDADTQADGAGEVQHP